MLETSTTSEVEIYIYNQDMDKDIDDLPPIGILILVDKTEYPKHRP